MWRTEPTMDARRAVRLAAAPTRAWETIALRMCAEWLKNPLKQAVFSWQFAKEGLAAGSRYNRTIAAAQPLQPDINRTGFPSPQTIVGVNARERAIDETD